MALFVQSNSKFILGFISAESLKIVQSVVWNSKYKNPEAFWPQNPKKIFACKFLRTTDLTIELKSFGSFDFFWGKGNDKKLSKMSLD